jgi:hypothetical protein
MASKSNLYGSRAKVSGPSSEGAGAPAGPPAEKHTRTQIAGKVGKANNKSKLSKDKVYVHALISRDLYEQLRRVAIDIYGKNHGAISFVVEDALRRYLHPFVRSNIKLNPRLSVKQVYEQVCEKIMDILGEPKKPHAVGEKVLDIAISEVRGPTVVERWKKFFAQEGLIKFVGGFPPNRTVELL